MKKHSERTVGRLYQSPQTKMVGVVSADLMLPKSWNAGHGEGNLPIEEEDPPIDDDGKGIKERGFGEIANSLW